MRLRRGWIPVLAHLALRAPTRAGQERALEALYFLGPESEHAKELSVGLLPLLETPNAAPPGAVGRAAEILGPVARGLDLRTRLARRVVHALGELLQNPYPDVRADAVYALGHIQSEAALRLLRSAVRDKGVFWAGRVGAYARYWRDVCRNHRPGREFRYRFSREPAYVKTDRIV
jgi:HEAT repeat protein